jgi:hypothetical protein
MGKLTIISVLPQADDDFVANLLGKMNNEPPPESSEFTELLAEEYMKTIHKIVDDCTTQEVMMQNLMPYLTKTEMLDDVQRVSDKMRVADEVMIAFHKVLSRDMRRFIAFKLIYS